MASSEEVRMLDGCLNVTDSYFTQTASELNPSWRTCFGPSEGSRRHTSAVCCTTRNLLFNSLEFTYCIYCFCTRTLKLFAWLSPNELGCNIFLMAHVYIRSALKLRGNRCSLLLLAVASFPQTALSLSTFIAFFNWVLKAGFNFFRCFRCIHFKRSDITDLALSHNL